jgi:hypothetical protein
MSAITQLLNYCATHPNVVIRYVASDMNLAIESDSSYLSESKAKSRVAGYYYLGNNPPNPQEAPITERPSPMANGAVHVLCQILQEIFASAAEAELAGLFHNGKEACPIRVALSEMGHPEPPTPIVTDNSTASGIANETVKQKGSKAMDMRFYWV